MESLQGSRGVPLKPGYLQVVWAPAAPCHLGRSVSWAVLSLLEVGSLFLNKKTYGSEAWRGIGVGSGYQFLRL